jgi:hypothetical protein
MSAKDFKFIAKTLSNLRVEAEKNGSDWQVCWETTRNEFARRLASDNPRFDRAKFFDACGEIS